MTWSDLYFRRTGISVENGLHHLAISLNLARAFACPTLFFCGSEEPSSTLLSPSVSSNKTNDQSPFEIKNTNYVSPLHRTRLSWGQSLWISIL